MPTYQQEYYQKNKERLKEKRTLWQKANRSKINAAIRRYRDNHPEVVMLTGARNRAKQFNIPCTIKRVDIVVPEFCPVFNIPLIYQQGVSSDNSPSLDRLIPELGYVPGNVRVISSKANRMKSNASLEELEAIITYIRSNIQKQC